MRLTSRTLGHAAAISIAAAAFPAIGGADQNSCQPGPAPVGGDPSASGGVNLHVTANNSVIWCSAQVIEVNHDIQDGTAYQVRSTKLSPSSTPVSNAISVGELLTLAGVPAVSVNHTEIERLSGGSSRLGSADLTDPSARFLGGAKPIFWINGSETQYLRPLRGASDTNGNDQIVASGGDALDFYIYSGPVLNVTARATPAKVDIKQSVTFTAHVTNHTASDGALTYKWAFQDGSTATGTSVRHSYAVAGTWYPAVTVQGAGNDSGGVSPPIPVTVGAPNTTGSNGSPGSDKNTTAGHGGPNTSHGTTPHSAPTHKRTAGSGANKTSGSNRAPTQPAHSTPKDTTPSQSTTPQATRPPATTPTVPTASPDKPVAKAHHAAAKPRRSTSHKKTLAQRDPGTTLVHGRLVSDVIAVSAAQLAQQTRTVAQSPSPARAPSARLGGGSVPPLAGLAGGCVIILLLGSGAGLELRSQRRSVTASRAA